MWSGFATGIEHGWSQIAEVLGAERREDVDIVCAGINHQTWYTRIEHQGRAISSQELLAAFETHPVYAKTEKVRIDVLRRFGYYSTESNGHLSEYLPWYRKRPEEIRRWIDMSSWGYGETGGYLRVSTEKRTWFETDFPAWMAAEDPPIDAADRSDERGSRIIEALETGRPYRGFFNVRNQGAISNLDDDAVGGSARLCGRAGHSHPAGWRPAAGLRGYLQCLDRRATHGRPCRRHRRRNAAEAGHAARSAGRGRVRPARDLADGGRDAGGPGAVAAAVPGRDSTGNRTAERALERDHARVARRRAEGCALAGGATGGRRAPTDAPTPGELTESPPAPG